MHTRQTLTAALLETLAREEVLLRAALANGAVVYEALRRGDLPGAYAAANEHQVIGDSMTDAARPRAAATAALARELGLAHPNLTLAALAAALPDPLAASLRAARTRLTAAATELAASQSRNANLIAHLRSYFRGALSEIGPQAPARYGPSGSRLERVTT